MIVQLITKLLISIVMATILAHSKESSKLFNPEQLQTLETKFAESLAEHKASPERRYYLYRLAGRELLNYRYYAKAEEYYLKALNTKFEANHSEIYINLVSIAVAQKDQSKIKVRAKACVDYFTKNYQYSSLALGRYLNYLKVTYLGVTDAKIKNSVLNDHYYGHFATFDEVLALIKQQKFHAALSFFNPDGLKDADIGRKIVYDLLNVLVNKRTVKTLLCSDLYKKYPNSNSYSMKLCRLLKGYLQNGTLNNAHLNNLERYFTTNHQDKKYLLSAIKRIKT